MGYSAIVSRLLLPAVSSISDDSWLLELVAGDDIKDGKNNSTGDKKKKKRRK